MPITDARSIADKATVDADLCIVGGGPAGISLAHELGGTGARIVVLESGGMEPSGPAQRLSAGENVGASGYPLEHSQVRSLGGSTKLWGAQCKRMDPIDFAARPWIAHSGWPVDMATLEPWYKRAEALCALPDTDMEGEGFLRPARESGLTTVRFRFGWPTDFGAMHGDALKASDSVRVLLNATCTELVTDAGGTRIESVSARTLSGNGFEVKAGAVVLAAGGIENPRLMLASTRHNAGGVGNAHDLVGRFYMDHPYLITGYLAEPAEGVATGPDVISSFKRAGWDQRTHLGYALSPEVQEAEELPGCVAYFVNRLASETDPDFFSAGARAMNAYRDARRFRDADGARARAALAGMAGDPGPILRTLVRRGREILRPGKVLALRIVAETTPVRDSRVTLSETRDALGNRLPRLDWRIAGGDRRAVDRLLDTLTRLVAEGGHGRLVTDPARDAHGWPASFHGGRHHMGTTRMHPDPRQGVVDADCRVHGVSNLYVAGSSVFPTGGYSNPTLTIVALALRLADHLRQRMAVQ